MQPKTREQILEWEARRSLPAGISALLGVVALIAAGVVSSDISGDGSAEILRATYAHASSATLSGILQALGFVLFAVPLFYLFRAVQARDSRVRSQLVGLVVIAPLFLAVSSGLSIVARHEAADQFVSGQAKSSLSVKAASEKCVSARNDKGAESFAEEFEPSKGGTALAACRETKIEDDEASNALSEASLASATSGFGVAGGLGLLVAFFYTSLWALRTGLLGRFWASLGMALGITVLIGFILFPMIWFVYIGLLLTGWVPGGRPPAWAAGEAIPWPTPGEKAAADLTGPSGDGEESGLFRDGEMAGPSGDGEMPEPSAGAEVATPSEGGETPGLSEGSAADRELAELESKTPPRKRKQRDVPSADPGDSADEEGSG